MFKGLSKILAKYQTLISQADQATIKLQSEYEKNQLETQQVLEAAEHLEQTNSSNLEKVRVMEQENGQLKHRIRQLEAQQMSQS